ncbi:exodeoxyribonuclease III [Clostridium pasteurianum]|uniref:Exodeoxyribonuclease III n=1 Tax=Clostridium pasteurianum BC1 TaxID=86416 RepID=R4K2C4_CLOPA|nr:exodeoxyribonuclease III [Clostridium pasteurianum]AGK97252.1 exodeoxyribonuclease III [Clostridium pasteurianum BC1]
MNIYSWNVNGLRAVSKKGFFEFFSNENPDILCIQETKLQLDNLSEEMKNINGYYSYFSCAEKKGYSGVATYTKEKPISVEHGIGIEKFDSEGRILITEFTDFILFNIYFPNGQKDEERLKYKLDFYDAILDYLNKLKVENKKLIICGDYNTAHNEIDIKNAKANEKYSGFLPIERAWIDKFISQGYADTFRSIHKDVVKYSWWSYRFKARERNAGWRIDYFFVTENLMKNIKSAEILNEVMGSDHCPVVISLDI